MDTPYLNSLFVSFYNLILIKQESEKASENEEQHIAKENQQKGKVTAEIYKSYFAAVKNLPFVICVVFLLLLTQIFHSSVSYFISIW